MTPLSTLKAGRSLWLGTFLLLMAASAAIFLLSPNPPILQDYPDWVYQGVVFARILTHHPTPNYAIHHYPVPNSLTTVGIALLTLTFGWQLASKLWIVLVLAALTFATLRLAKNLRLNTLAVLPALACSILLGPDLWEGSINFQLGLAFLFLLIAELVRPGPSSTRTALLLLLCFFTHMLPCAAGLLALTALALQHRAPRRLIPALPTLALLAWYVLAREPIPNSGASPTHLVPALLAVAGVLLYFGQTQRNRQSKTAALLLLPDTFATAPILLVVKAESLLALFGPLNVLPSGPSPDHVLWRPALFFAFDALGALATLIALAHLLRLWAGLARHGSPFRFLVCTSLALALLFLLLPSDALGVAGLDRRLLHLSLALGLLLLGTTNSRWLPLLGILSTVVCGANLYQSLAVQRDLTAISLPRDTPLPLGASAVGPAIRLNYFQDLQQNTYTDWIFPTAMLSSKQ